MKAKLILCTVAVLAAAYNFSGLKSGHPAELKELKASALTKVCDTGTGECETDGGVYSGKIKTASGGLQEN